MRCPPEVESVKQEPYLQLMEPTVEKTRSIDLYFSFLFVCLFVVVVVVFYFVNKLSIQAQFVRFCCFAFALFVFVCLFVVVVVVVFYFCKQTFCSGAVCSFLLFCVRFVFVCLFVCFLNQKIHHNY